MSNSLIADSGATKTDWCLVLANGNTQLFHTDGISPHYQTEDEIYHTLNTQLLPLLESIAPIEQLYFYGTGCSSEANQTRVAAALSRAFPVTSACEVNHDLLGTARALFGTQTGMVGILGTGSNAALYQAPNKLNAALPNLGFWLGDEGSAGFFGKQLVIDYMHGQMPGPMQRDFQQRYHINLETLLENVYQKPFPNRYLAGFAPFLQIHDSEPYCSGLLRQGFGLFLDKYICALPDYTQHPLGLSGSVALHHQVLLGQLCKSRGIKLSKVLQSPIEGLVNYHRQTA
ncbi:hypothetical protein [Eisenibacter elegans]|uniref:hypothetical protein n=1 Tax=Eisenibacter elegans TaxID=997 RepID=UPI000416F7F5|nr:hypothetical protein [Eisenibacter elegans]